MANEIEVKAVRLDSLINTPGIKNRFNEVLGKKAASFMSSVVSAVKTNKKLMEAEPMSVISAAMVAATLDLPINQNLGFAYIVPYNGMAQFQMGYKGFIQLGMRTGKYKTMNVTEIYEGELVKFDKFKGLYEFTDTPKSDKIIGYLFYFELLNGYSKQVYWTHEKMEKHAEKYSQAYKYDLREKKKESFWSKDFTSQALKTVIKNGLAKWGILSVEMMDAIAKDGGVIDLEKGDIQYVDGQEEVEQPIKEAQTTSARLKQAIDVTPTPSEIETKKKLKEQAESLKNQPQEPVKAPKVGVGELTHEKVSQIKSQMDICTNTENLTEFYNSLGQEAMNHPDIKPYYASNWKMLKSAKK